MRPPAAEWGELTDVNVFESLDISSVIKSQVEICQQQTGLNSFRVCDLGSIVDKYHQWTSLLPSVTPSYVVGCSDDPSVLKMLSKLGARFTCATKNEIERVMEAGVEASRVAFMNPVKQMSHVKYAGKIGVPLVGFDSESELKKIKAQYSKANLVLQISAGSGELDWVRGCGVKQARHLLRAAQKLGLSVTGISAELGRALTHCDATGPILERAVGTLKIVYDIAAEEGVTLTFIDLGNITSDWSNDSWNFTEIAGSLQALLENNFPSSLDLQLIGRVDRFFISEAFTLVTSVIAKRSLHGSSGNCADGMDTVGDQTFCYYLNDGVYGAFTRLLCDKILVRPTVFKAADCSDIQYYTSSLMGPTCDDLDCVVQSCLLPELSVGDWLIFDGMGGVSAPHSVQSDFCYYVMDDLLWSALNPVTPGDDYSTLENTLNPQHSPFFASDSSSNDYDDNNNKAEQWLDV